MTVFGLFNFFSFLLRGGRSARLLTYKCLALGVEEKKSSLITKGPYKLPFDVVGWILWAGQGPRRHFGFWVEMCSPAHT